MDQPLLNDQRVALPNSNPGVAMGSSLRKLLSPFGCRQPLFIGFLCLAAAIPVFFALYTHLANFEAIFGVYHRSD